MEVGKAIQNARRKAGMTQEQLAAKVYVTRQAVSRWETGESEPSIDMRKLLASVLDIPVRDLFDLPDTPSCQCCGTPFDVPNMPFGTNADGTENPDYCGWCYQNGAFTSSGLDEIIERNVPYLRQATGYTQEEAVSFMGALLPTLKRWSSALRVPRLRERGVVDGRGVGHVLWERARAARRQDKRWGSRRHRGSCRWIPTGVRQPPHDQGGPLAVHRCDWRRPYPHQASLPRAGSARRVPPAGTLPDICVRTGLRPGRICNQGVLPFEQKGYSHLTKRGTPLVKNRG